MGGPLAEGRALTVAWDDAARAAGVVVPEVLDVVSSTQDVVRAWADAGEPSGRWVVARAQSAGRGRLGRVWQTEDGLALSVLVRPALPAHRLGLLPLACAVAVREVCVDDDGRPVLGIKWPNDLLAADGRKVSGLLCEAELTGGRVRHVVVGVGVNLARAPESLPAACLSELGVSLPREVIAARLVGAILTWCGRVAPSPDLVLEAWTRGSVTIGRRVRVAGVEGDAVEVASDGALRLRRDDGSLHVVRAGDVEPAAPETSR